MRNYWTADFLAELPDEAIDILCEYHVSRASPTSQILVIPGGGAIAEVPEDATAFGQRTSPFNIHIISGWPDPADDEVNIAWAKELGAAMRSTPPAGRTSTTSARRARTASARRSVRRPTPASRR